MGGIFHLSLVVLEDTMSVARLAYLGPMGCGFLLNASAVGFGFLPLLDEVGFLVVFLVVVRGAVVVVVDGSEGSGWYSGSAG